MQVLEGLRGRDDAVRLPFGGRLPAGFFLAASLLAGAFLLLLVVVPINR
ncbi:hypothetical protein Ga0074812_107186 [Parafrankia irregularis]|uniref:Uncharacterized protein n=1 Tax=Parafrankia irregularis TaxID=795642 RepID=A0A0S4QMI5_9ACTN|nr:hypothetical protein Ga0074812_107186 [Parafrankia irregularis]